MDDIFESSKVAPIYMAKSLIFWVSNGLGLDQLLTATWVAIVVKQGVLRRGEVGVSEI